jgi:hypothetical protein
MLLNGAALENLEVLENTEGEGVRGGGSNLHHSQCSKLGGTWVTRGGRFQLM